MNTMVRIGDFFVRLRDQGDRPKLTVWNNSGTKIISEFIGSATPAVWEQIEKLTTQEVVDEVHALLQEK
ncbi:MAG: hypothetical protein GX331_04430 [Firmicutes bacterium]|jgi:hypothetical protein|nr:hypothetical protein [Bacillota bacterium]